jgi:hypothetical protein
VRLLSFLYDHLRNLNSYYHIHKFDIISLAYVLATPLATLLLNSFIAGVKISCLPDMPKLSAACTTASVEGLPVISSEQFFV